MRATPIMLAIGLALGLPANELALAASPKGEQSHDQVRRTYIVSFEEAPLALFQGFGDDRSRPALAPTSPAATGSRSLDVKSRAAVEYRRYLSDLRNIRLREASAKVGRSLEPRFVYDVANNAVSLSLTAEEARLVASVPGVRRARLQRVDRLMTDRGPTWIKANTLWDGSANGGIAKKGEGIIVGVVDSGIRSNHPSFAQLASDGYSHVNPKGAFLGLCAGGGATCNNKLIGIYDFTTGTSSRETNNGLDNDGSNPTTCVPAGSSTNRCSGHGTHTAGTAAANPTSFTTSTFGPSYEVSISGVAPRANIISYKGCEALAGCPEEWTLGAIGQAITDQVHVINYSIGGSPDDPYLAVGSGGERDDSSEAMLAARAAGIVVAVAAGNDGPDPGTLSSPSNSPWVISVGATSHDRLAANNLVGLTATGAGAAPGGAGGLVGTGNTGTISALASAPIVIANPFACAEGENPDSDPPTGVSKPAAWTSSTYAGKIVVCQRSGFYARVAKAHNVKNAGGVGMILVNRIEEGDSIVPLNYADFPSIHLTYLDGQALLTWLASGTGHAGSLAGVSVRNLAAYGDKLGDFTGRGPVIPEGIVKPDVTAPGIEILAASGLSGSGYHALTGTSMASPHVAGAAALLKSAKPTWTPSQIHSALVLTARPSNVENGVTVTPHDQGAGTVDLQQAVQAGLYLNVTDAQFKASSAATAHTLNLPSFARQDCFQSCSFSRSFTDMAGGGTYSIEATLSSGATLTPSPSSFTVGNGASQAVSFNFDVSSAAALGKWIYGEVRLVKTAGNGATTLRMPVAIFSSPFQSGFPPADVIQNVAGERGFFDHALGGMAALSNARFVATDLAPVKTVTTNIALDTTNSNPYDSTTGTYRDSLVIPASPVGGPVTYKIKVTTSAAQPDIDLYVGLDADGDGAEAGEQLCMSTSAASEEECELTVQTGSSPQTYWFLAQNWSGAGTGVTIRSYAVPMVAGSKRSLVATGPGNIPALTNFSIRLGYDDPSMLSGDQRIGFVLVQATPGNTAYELPVLLTRTASGFQPYALANGEARSVTLPAGATHDKLFFDVPPNATSVTFSTTGTGTVALGVAHLASPTIPNIQSAPVSNNSNADVAGANETITLTGGSLLPGRWYVKPTNNGASPATISVTATINTANAAAAFKPGSYYNPGRGGHGLFIYKVSGVWFALWYHYLQDGTPTWYQLQATAPTGRDWSAGIYRAAYNGTSTFLTQIGTAHLSLTSENTLSINYNIDGETGSETMSAFLTGCPTVNSSPLDVSAAWYNPGTSGFGYSFQLNPNYEFAALFIYDSLGVPRFLAAERGGAFDAGSPTLPVLQTQGFCPLCVRTPPTRTQVGTLTRTYGSNEIVDVGVNATYINGVPGSWSRSTQVDILGSPQGCTP